MALDVVAGCAFANVACGMGARARPDRREESLGGAAVWGLVHAAERRRVVVGGLIALRIRPRAPLFVGVVAITLLIPPLALLGSGALAGDRRVALLAGIGLEIFSVFWDISLQPHVPIDRLSRVSAWDSLGSLVAAAGRIGARRPAVRGGRGRGDTLVVPAIVLVPNAVQLLTRDTYASCPDLPAGAALAVLCFDHDTDLRGTGRRSPPTLPSRTLSARRRDRRSGGARAGQPDAEPDRRARASTARDGGRVDAALAAIGDDVTCYVAVAPRRAAGRSCPTGCGAAGSSPAGAGWRSAAASSRSRRRPTLAPARRVDARRGADVRPDRRHVGYGLPEAVEPGLRMRHSRLGCWLALDGDEPAAAAGVFVAEGVGYLGFAATLPEHRGKGAPERAARRADRAARASSAATSS